MFELAGTTTLVTGAAKRLGRAIALATAAAGSNVIVHYHSSAGEAGQTAAEIRATGVEAWTIPADLSTPDSAERFFDEAVSRAGTIDYLVNSASIFPTDTLAEIDEKSLVDNLRINAIAPFVLARRLAERLTGSERRGCIVNLLDTRISDYDRKHVSYHLSKRTLFTMTRMMSVEYAPLVRVNAVAPGLILPPPGEDDGYLGRMSGTNALGTHGTPEQIAAAVLFLLWNEFVTGEVIHVDGGRRLRGSMYGL